ncbi:hypothetical protein JIN85_12000 [Luteolibacter pohnpeiensis]|uniref:PEP-CTERM protein-sorting domain-containing protein n=1 Tax=Luteolibacter pohnpeiensis TaxID=454153 RepID=A0A934VX35_9BACT|nr:hypothetical protein [Luteolibacter pohnpeiensis]MBK1883144.1 hypothetical protein [Luteolibacter pohnpeiensis]
MLRSSLLLGALVGLAASAHASTISINFVGYGGADGTLFSDEAAGVVSAANWNNVRPDVESDINYSSGFLMDSAGSATSVTISWLSIGPYYISTGTATGDNVMYNGYLDNFGDSRTVTISGLSPTETYNIYLYSDGDNGTNSRTGTFTMGGVTTSITDDPGNFDGSFVEVSAGATGVGNYTVFTLTGSSSYDLTFHGNTSDDLPRAALNGIQIVSVPEPSLTLLGLLGLVPLLRRRRN